MQISNPTAPPVSLAYLSTALQPSIPLMPSHSDCNRKFSPTAHYQVRLHCPHFSVLSIPSPLIASPPTLAPPTPLQSYFDRKFSSTVITSLITATPIIADIKLLRAYRQGFGGRGRGGAMVGRGQRRGAGQGARAGQRAEQGRGKRGAGQEEREGWARGKRAVEGGMGSLALRVWQGRPRELGTSWCQGGNVGSKC